MKSFAFGFMVLSSALLYAALLSGCDTVQPESVGTLVVEAYMDAEKPLPGIRVHETADVSGDLADVRIPVSHALITLTVNGDRINYRAVADTAGLYRPDLIVEKRLHALDRFTLSVTADTREVSGSGMVPPSIQMRNIQVAAFPEAVEAVLIDSLDLGLDSLNVSIDAIEGFIFPVEVSIDWPATDESMSETDFWIETRLDPVLRFSSSLLDFFLLPEQILPESGIKTTEEGLHRWTGIYAVPVPDKDSLLPAHDLKISILRSDPSYARFSTTGNEPNRRSPVGNVSGGIGFIGGISVDSTWVSVN